MDDLLADFLSETRADLDRAHDALARLEQGAAADEELNHIKRGVAGIRSHCAALGFGRIAALAEGALALADRLHITGEVSPSDTRTLRRAVDRITRLIATIAATGAEPQGGDPDIAQALTQDGDAVRRLARLETETAGLHAGEPDSWDAIERAVQDICLQLSKSVSIIIEPAARALPGELVQALSGPLERVLRYMCVYSLEHDLVRRARGKRAGGTIRISALRLGADAVIAVSDDGAGLDLERLRRRAVAIGLIAKAQAADMPDVRAADLIFAPKISSMGELGDTCGLDSARTIVAALGGGVEVNTIAGRGATFLLRAPITQSFSKNIEGAA